MREQESIQPSFERVDFDQDNQRWTLSGHSVDRADGVLYDVYYESGQWAGLYDVKFRTENQVVLKPYGNFKLVDGVFYSLKYRTVERKEPQDVMDFVLREGQVHVDFKFHSTN